MFNLLCLTISIKIWMAKPLNLVLKLLKQENIQELLFSLTIVTTYVCSPEKCIKLHKLFLAKNRVTIKIKYFN